MYEWKEGIVEELVFKQARLKLKETLADLNTLSVSQILLSQSLK